MNIKKIVFVLILIIIISFLSASDKVVARFEAPTQAIIKEFTPQNYDIAAFKPGKFLDIVISLRKFEELIEQGYDLQITQTKETMSNNLGRDHELDGYRDYNELLSELQQLETDYPNLCKLYDIGNSRGKNYSDAGNANYDEYNHEIWTMKVSDNVETEEDEPGIYFVAEHHAREPISLEVAMTILNHILDNYGSDPQITENIDNTQIWFVPLLNPDGHKIVTEEIELMWRKNICDNNENGEIDVSGYYADDGVDPNRNYGWEWGGAGTSWYSETYQGTSAFSEPETQAFKTLLADHHFVAGISYHSYGELVLFPFGYASGIYSPDHDAQEELAQELAYAIPAQYGGFYTPQEAWGLYPCTGTTEDYAYGEHGIFSHTIELATEFIPPASQVDDICADNLEAGLILMNRASHQLLTGHITDANSNEPLVAEIFIDGIDDTGEFRNPYQSKETFGTYYRLLTAGSYDVTFSAFGYESQTFNNIQITEDEATILDVQLLPSSNTIDLTGFVYNGVNGEPISDATVAIQGFDIPPATTNNSGAYTIPDIYEYNYDIAVYAAEFAGIIDNYAVNPNNNAIDFDLFALDDGTFETGEYNNSWQFSGNADWIIDQDNSYNGNYSARSGNISDEQTSSLSVSMFVNNPAEISFARKVSSEEDYDFLKFLIDNELIDMWSGNMDWAEVNYPVAPGFHTFTWEYYKDQAVTNGEDCGWIDDIIFPSATLSINPAMLEFFTYENCVDGLEFTITNNSPASVIINEITEIGTEFDWYIDNLNLSFPYELESGVSLEFNVKVNLPVDLSQREIISDIMTIDTEIGIYEIELFFDDTLLTNADDHLISTPKLLGNFPNPFNPTTTLHFNIPPDQPEEAVLEIFNVRGQKIRTFQINEISNLSQKVVWDGKNEDHQPVSSGIYLYRLKYGNKLIDNKKMIMLK